MTLFLIELFEITNVEIGHDGIAGGRKGEAVYEVRWKREFRNTICRASKARALD